MVTLSYLLLRRAFSKGLAAVGLGTELEPLVCLRHSTVACGRADYVLQAQAGQIRSDVIMIVVQHAFRNRVVPREQACPDACLRTKSRNAVQCNFALSRCTAVVRCIQQAVYECTAG